MNTPTTPHMTSADFERWLALRLELGWRVSNPDNVARIRAELRQGATLAPFRQVSTNSPNDRCPAH